MLIFDLGFLNFDVFDWLTEHGLFRLTRAQQNMVCQEERVLQNLTHVLDPAVLPAEYGVALYGQRWF